VLKVYASHRLTCVQELLRLFKGKKRLLQPMPSDDKRSLGSGEQKKNPKKLTSVCLASKKFLT
jgi:hypothetical protein